MKNIERNVCRYEYVTIFLWRKLAAQNFISNSFTCACVWCFIYVATSTTIKYVFTDINSSIYILLSSLYCIRVLIHKITFGMRNKAKVCIICQWWSTHICYIRFAEHQYKYTFPPRRKSQMTAPLFFPLNLSDIIKILINGPHMHQLSVLPFVSLIIISDKAKFVYAFTFILPSKWKNPLGWLVDWSNLILMSSVALSLWLVWCRKIE